MTKQTLEPREVLRAWAKIADAAWTASLDLYLSFLGPPSAQLRPGEVKIPQMMKVTQRPEMRNVVHEPSGDPLDPQKYIVAFTPPEVDPLEASTDSGWTEVKGIVISTGPGDPPPPPAGNYVGELWLIGEENGQKVSETPFREQFTVRPEG